VPVLPAATDKTLSTCDGGYDTVLSSVDASFTICTGELASKGPSAAPAWFENNQTTIRN
jgi:hypothetical protein